MEPEPPTITLAEQIAEVRREIAMRKVVYPGLCARKKLTTARAARQLEVMETVLELLQRQEAAP
jgi:hypothetical protein